MGDTSRLYSSIESGEEFKSKGYYFLAACEFKIASWVYDYGDPYGYFPDKDPYYEFRKCYKKLSDKEHRQIDEIKGGYYEVIDGLSRLIIDTIEKNQNKVL